MEKAHKKRFDKSPIWMQIKDQLKMTGEQMIALSDRFAEDGHNHLTEDDKFLVVSAYSGYIAAVTNTMKVNLISRSRDRVVDDIEEIHRIIEILDCL
jgi:hypothetical protein